MRRVLSAFMAMALLPTLVFGAASASPKISAEVRASQAVSASQKSNDYSIKVVNETVQFVRDGAVKGAYQAKTPVVLSILTNKGGDLLVRIPLSDGKRKNINLKDQSNLNLDGKIHKLQLEKSLPASLTVSTSRTIRIDQLTVKSKSNVTISGKVEKLLVSAAARVSIGKASTVKQIRVTSSSASLTVDKNATVQDVSSVNKSAISGVSAVKKLTETSEKSSREPASSDRTSSSDRPGPTPVPPTPSDPVPPINPIEPQPPMPVPPPQPPEPEAVDIANIYPTNGNIRVELTHPVELDLSNFHISCPTGKDMTILSADTVTGADQNRIYNLLTAYYDSNTYELHITLPDGKEISKTFQAGFSLPTLTDFSAERKSDTDAEVTFVSDSAGRLYYMAAPTAKAAIGVSPPQSALEIQQNGEFMPIASGKYTVKISGLTENVPYTVYMAVADTDGENLSDILPTQKVPANPAKDPEPGELQIVSIETINTNSFRIVFSKPTAQPLELSAINATCPSGPLTLGKIETTDKQVYDVFLKENYHYYPKNTYRVTITLPDSTVLTGSFYAETYPQIGLIEGKRSSDGTVVMTFSSDKPGTIYYGTVPTDEDKPSDVNWVIENGIKGELLAGQNVLTLTNVPTDHMQFYLVAIDEKGNMAVFVDGGKIKDASVLQAEGGVSAGADLAPATVQEEAAGNTGTPLQEENTGNTGSPDSFTGIAVDQEASTDPQTAESLNEQNPIVNGEL